MNEAVQVLVPQLLETLKATVLVPPQALGPAVPPLFVTVPPVAAAVPRLGGQSFYACDASALGAFAGHMFDRARAAVLAA